VESLPFRTAIFRRDHDRLWIGSKTQVPQVCAQQCRVVFHLMRRNFLCHFAQLTFVTMVTVEYDVDCNCTILNRLPMAGWVAGWLAGRVITGRQVS